MILRNRALFAGALLVSALALLVVGGYLLGGARGPSEVSPNSQDAGAIEDPAPLHPGQEGRPRPLVDSKDEIVSRDPAPGSAPETNPLDDPGTLSGRLYLTRRNWGDVKHPYKAVEGVTVAIHGSDNRTLGIFGPSDEQGHAHGTLRLPESNEDSLWLRCVDPLLAVADSHRDATVPELTGRDGRLWYTCHVYDSADIRVLSRGQGDDGPYTARFWAADEDLPLWSSRPVKYPREIPAANEFVWDDYALKIPSTEVVGMTILRPDGGVVLERVVRFDEGLASLSLEASARAHLHSVVLELVDLTAEGEVGDAQVLVLPEGVMEQHGPRIFPEKRHYTRSDGVISYSQRVTLTAGTSSTVHLLPGVTYEVYWEGNEFAATIPPQAGYITLEAKAP